MPSHHLKPWREKVSKYVHDHSWYFFTVLYAVFPESDYTHASAYYIMHIIQIIIAKNFREAILHMIHTCLYHSCQEQQLHRWENSIEVKNCFSIAISDDLLRVVVSSNANRNISELMNILYIISPSYLWSDSFIHSQLFMNVAYYIYWVIYIGYTWAGFWRHSLYIFK